MVESRRSPPDGASATMAGTPALKLVHKAQPHGIQLANKVQRELRLPCLIRQVEKTEHDLLHPLSGLPGTP